MKICQLRNFVNIKVQWSLKEIDSLLQKVQQMIAEKATVEFTMNERKIEHQYRALQRLEKPSVASALRINDDFGIFECRDFLNKRANQLNETSVPIACNGLLWQLECDFNCAVNDFISVKVSGTQCRALKQDPQSITSIKVVLLHPT